MSSLINILSRTHNRPEYFQVLKDSIESQTYKDIKWIVGSDTSCPYFPAIRLIQDSRQPLFIPFGHYYAPWNLYLNQMQELVTDGWLTYLDDDDRYVDENSLQIIANNIEDEDTVLVWKVRITPTFIVPSFSFGHKITACDFSGIGLCFHSKHLPVDWGCLSMGDFRVGNQLESRGLKIKWIDQILTETQAGAHNGR